MSRPILIVAPTSDPSELFAALERARLEAVLLLPSGASHAYGHLEIIRCPELTADAITAAAREHGALGVWTDDPAHAMHAAAAAARLGWPTQEAGARAQVSLEVLQRLLEEGAPVAPVVQVHGAASAAEAMRSLGQPVLMRAEGPWGQGACYLVDHEADLPLALERARKALPDAALVLQKPAAGKSLCVAGFRLHREFHPADIVALEMLPGPCRVPVELSLPPGLSGESFVKALGLAKRAAEALPPGYGYVEVELAGTDHGPVITGISLPPRPHPAMHRTLELALGINLLAECLRVAAGGPPRLSPSRDLAVCAAWLLSRSGMVEDISHTREALAMEGVHSLHIAAQPGQTLGHIVDTESRDRTGYVLAMRPTRDEALKAARAARDCIEIATRPML